MSASSSSWVPRPTTAPSSITTIWSASAIVATRCATISTVALAVTRFQRPSQPGIGDLVEGGEGVVEQIQVGTSDQRPGDREALALTTGDVGPPLSDRCVQSLGHGLDEIASLGDRRAPPTSPRPSHPACRTAGCWPPCPRREMASGERARSWPTACRDPDHERPRRRSTPSRLVASNSRGMRLTRVVFPAPVDPMIATVWPGRAEKVTSSTTGWLAPG